MSREFHMVQSGLRDAGLSPTENSRDWAFDELGYGGGSAQAVDDFWCGVFHGGNQYAIIGSLSQEIKSDNRDCGSRKSFHNAAMSVPIRIAAEAQAIFEKLDALNLKQRDLASALGIEENKVSKVRAGQRQFKAGEVLIAREWLERRESDQDFSRSPDLSDADLKIEYVPINVLPTFAGMGGGGNGEGDGEVALVARILIEEMLRGKPSDFLLVNVRGDSMEPDFRHGDQLLVDCRDRSPSQPGPFAVWDGEWGEYVIKNVERSRSGEVRIFSSNAKYAGEIVQSETTRIIGRPVWFGRRL